ncbi:MAG TPA: hypothetical protein V6C99_05160 [Oculatellaceae cyanobacterium]|jgi:hypothetical protein
MVEKPSQYIDISKFPDDEKPHIIGLALAHNALCEDVDRISGATAEEKMEMHAIFGKIRVLLRHLHGRRFSISLLTLEVGFIIFILDRLGVDTRTLIPELLRFVHLLQG